MGILLGVAGIIAGYLLGSFPSAYIITRIIKRVDIREIDVGNMGAAAVRRQLGLLPAIIVAVLDITKGSAAIFLAQFFSETGFLWVYGAGFAAILGHCFPAYIGFRGGQGTATLIGVFAVLAPLVTLIMLCIAALMLLITRRVFPMIISSSPALPLLLWLVAGSVPLALYSLFLILFMMSRNIGGISREIKIIKSRKNGIRHT
jgi:acyl phosphate:glycerol-3-phosphate acyltransferase